MLAQTTNFIVRNTRNLHFYTMYERASQTTALRALLLVNNFRVYDVVLLESTAILERTQDATRRGLAWHMSIAPIALT